MRRVLVILLTVIATATVAGGGVYYWQSSQAKDQIGVLKGDNASLQLRVNELETAATQKPAATPDPAPTPTAAPATPASDQDTVIALVKADCAAQPGVDLTKSTFGGIPAIDATFAWVNFNCNNTGPNRAILKKTGADWAIIYKGTKKPPAATITKYAIPPAYQ